MIKKAQKKPIIIETIQYDGNNFEEIENFIGLGLSKGKDNTLIIQTLEGLMMAKKGYWIIKGINSEFYPCDPDIFEKTYDIL